jgi:hypothetical protein
VARPGRADLVQPGGAFRAYGGLGNPRTRRRLDYRIDLGASRGTAIRFGALYRTTGRDAYDTGYAIRSREWTPNDPRWQLAPEQFFDGRFSGNGERSSSWASSTPAATTARRTGSSPATAWWSGRCDPRLRFIGGARVERSELTLAYEDVLGTRGVAEPSTRTCCPLRVHPRPDRRTEAARLRVADAGPAGVPRDRAHLLPCRPRRGAALRQPGPASGR